MHRSIINIDHYVVVDDDGESKNSVVFLFTGHGSQYAGMGQELYNENEVFCEAMDQCEGIYKALTDGESLINIIFNRKEEGLVMSNAQPALVALEWSLTRMWQSNDVTPSILLGHSIWVR